MNLKSFLFLLSLGGILSIKSIKSLSKKGREYLYLASEIEKSSMRVTKKRYPKTIHVGDVKNLTVDLINNIVKNNTMIVLLWYFVFPYIDLYTP